MEIKKIFDGAVLTVKLIGRLDAVTAFELDKDLQTTLNSVTMYNTMSNSRSR